MLTYDQWLALVKICLLTPVAVLSAIMSIYCFRQAARCFDWFQPQYGNPDLYYTNRMQGRREYHK